jgi:Ion channel
MQSRQIRRIFFRELFRLVRVVWPIISWVLFAMAGPGLLIGQIEGWRIDEALYFTFVTGLTIGYGDLTPRHVVSRLLAVVIGFAGILLTGLIVALSVEALRVTAAFYRIETGRPASFGSTTCTTRQGPKEEYQANDYPDPTP